LIGRIAAMSGAAGDVDDLAAAFLAEMRHGELAELGRRYEIHLHHLRESTLPIRHRCRDRGRDEDAGIVDDDVDARGSGFRVAPQRAGGIGFSEIGGNEMTGRRADLGADLFGGLSAFRIVKQHRGAGARDGAHDGGANPARSACDQDGLPLEVGHVQESGQMIAALSRRLYFCPETQ
jgi:hypothetical protein